MSNILATRDFSIQHDADYRIRTRGTFTGTTKEEEVLVDFGNLREYVSSTDLDIAYMAASLFAYEKLFRDEDVRQVKGNDTLTVVLNDLKPFQGKGIGKLIGNLISFNLKVPLKVVFHGLQNPRITRTKHADKKFRSVTLFSGGIDSLVGISSTHDKLGPTHGVYISQGDVMNSVVAALSDRLRKKEKLTIHSTRIQRGPELLQQFRGFVYLVLGCI
ncbi:MAG TPA: hypothetical protein VGR56_02905, partial [Nitrososphaerales archaeon]|nr:hypothetical protein [Nitrososphaerales archaeon]